MKKKRVSRHLYADQNGIAAVEFGLIGGVFMMLLMGGFDLGHTIYVKTTLEGVMQDASRSSALQSGSVAAQQAALDTSVRSQVQNLNKSANVTFSRRFYKTFTAANNRRHENDINSSVAAKNNDGICETGAETYLDANNNNVYDTDGGNQGQGGAQDAVIYTATVTYPRLFPLAGLIGLESTVTVKAATVMQNQPYSAQSTYGPATVRSC